MRNVGRCRPSQVILQPLETARNQNFLRPAAITRSRAVRIHVDPSALHSLPRAFAIRRFIATTEDSDRSRRLSSLGGVAALDRKLGRSRPTSGALLAYLSASSCRVVLADPAGINSAWPTI